MVYRQPIRPDELCDISPPSEELAHYGILGMHWGIRRFQPYSTTGPRKGGKTGKEIGLAKKRGKLSQMESPMAAYKRKKKEKAARAAEEKKEREAQIKKEYEENPDKIKRSADPETIHKYQYNMTDKEFKDAIDRIKNQNSLNELRAARKPSPKKKLKNVNDVLDNLFKAATTSVKIKNTIKKLLEGKDGKTENEIAKVLKEAIADTAEKEKPEKSSAKTVNEKAPTYGNFNDTEEAVRELYKMVGATPTYSLPKNDDDDYYEFKNWKKRHGG